MGATHERSEILLEENHRPINFELTTIVIEIEATLNNRPLTYVHDDSEGVSHALTPADLIYGRRVATSPNRQQFDISSTNKTLTK